METDELRFEKIVMEHKSTIYTVCYMFSNDKEEVEDLFQEVLINMWRGYSSFRGEAKLDTWIWRISLNTCISADRKKKKRGFKVSWDAAKEMPDDSSRDTRQVEQLHARISKLALVDRAIVLLWLENMSYDEIGAIVGITAKNVSVRLVRIRQQLASMSTSHEE